MSMFSLGGAVFGMTEESIPFIAMFVPLSFAIGYDSIVAVAMSYLACVVGFSSAMLNPFTVGIVQSIAVIPIFSGAQGMIGAAIMIGLVRGIVVITENAQIIDRFLYQLSSIIGKLPSLLAAYVMLPIQMFINFFIGSGSGQAALTMPILAPLNESKGL